ncbi:selenocysteine-specific translation elongation factor [Mediterraneibacter massiliensis]|uniref:selenocysteine-specific translation elongation factor n=1 Tax=Mediterraneibacter massiliensis TaxID=1720300 RepID=UPI0024AC9235|nr:selenocysteine-specific translation elongation factor [Mediterraneibacter massiliensis]
MRNVIIGTAGHIDHGKTALIKALTGRDTDRLEEEKRRGITIDLGFTYFELKDGSRAGIIDVPGHEKFIHNMTAGVVGMDLVLLVIAADEGIMPQTREHMDILHLLGVQNCILVLNKCDLAEEQWLCMIEEEIRSEIKGSFIENAPLVRVSAATGEGIGHLKEEIEKRIRTSVKEEKQDMPVRLPIDRVFSLTGFGTIVTGTLLGGRIEKGDVLTIYPSGLPCRVRNIQVHEQNVERCFAGQRAALNLAGCTKEEIKRGCVLAAEGTMQNSRIVDGKLTLLKNSKRTIKNQTRLHFLSGTSQTLCRVSLLDVQELKPGESAYVQFRMEEEIALKEKDRFIVRFYSPLETIGGGMVLDACSRKKKRFQPAVIEELQDREKGKTEDLLSMQIEKICQVPTAESCLMEMTGLTKEKVQTIVGRMEEENKLFCMKIQEEPYWWTSAQESGCRKKIKQDVDAYMEQYPYRLGAPRAEVKGRFLKTVKKSVFDAYVEILERERVLMSRQEFLLPFHYQVPKEGAYQEVRRKLYAAIKPAKYDFVRLSDISFGKTPRQTVDEILLLLMAKGEIVKVSEDIYTTKAYIDAAKEQITEKLKTDGKITIAQVRDMFSTSRRSAKPILEYMDKIKITRKEGAESERVSNL